jgi:hypothetical protein
MNDFFNTPKIVTEETCKLPWRGNRNGKYFFCGLCGHQFIVGDEYTIIFTNDIKEAGGNPIICKSCNSSDVKQKWINRCKEFNSDKFKWFRIRQYEH